MRIELSYATEGGKPRTIVNTKRDRDEARALMSCSDGVVATALGPDGHWRVEVYRKNGSFLSEVPEVYEGSLL